MEIDNGNGLIKRATRADSSVQQQMEKQLNGPRCGSRQRDNE